MTTLLDLARIGPSDFGALAGLDPWRGPVDVYDRIVLGARAETTDRMRRGQHLEAGVAAWWAADHEMDLVPGTSVLCSTPREHLRYTVDYWATHRHADRAPAAEILEVKTCSRWTGWGESLSSEVPPHYLAQVQGYLALTGAPGAWIACLGPSLERRDYPIVADAELGEMLLELAARFWRDHVIPRKQPPLTPGSPRLAEAIARRFPAHTAPLRPATDEEAVLAAQLACARADLSGLEKHVLDLENALKVAIGEGEGIEGSFGRITWRRAKDSTSPDWEAIARALDPGGSQIAPLEQHLVKTRSGGRRFLCRFDPGEGDAP